MKKIFLLLGILLPGVASAHETWFVSHIPEGLGKPVLFSTFNAVNISFVVLAVFAFLMAIIFDSAIAKQPQNKKAEEFFHRIQNWIPILLRSLTGILLIYGSLNGFVFAFDMRPALDAPLTQTLFTAQMVAGFAFVTGILPRLAALLGAALYIAMFFIFPLMMPLSYLWYMGIFAYLFAVGDPTLPKFLQTSFFPALRKWIHPEKLIPYAMPALRVLLGFSLIYVAYLYKIYLPQYALQIVEVNHLNFMQTLGVGWFTNEMFVLAAALIEILLGTMLVVGVLPRLVGFAMTVCFTLMIFILGIMELIGHLPMYAIAFALMVHGKKSFVPGKKTA